MSDPSSIAEYRFLCLLRRQATRDRAERLRARWPGFPLATLGHWHDELVGPHTQSMYQIAFPASELASFLPWLMLNRNGLSILLHPETGDDYRDHSTHAAWLGPALPLRLDAFSAQRTPD
jgi:DOPA 4,5-dioxygenase